MKKRVKALFRAHKAVGRLKLDLLDVLPINEHPAKLTEAKKLHAEIYRNINFVDDTDLIDGIIHHEADPHQKHAYYFGVYDKYTDQLLAVARQISYTKEKGYSSFPVLEQATIYKSYKKILKSTPPEQIVEISAMVKSKNAGTEATLYLFREMLRHSVREKHRYWVMALDTNYNKSLKALFGDSYRKIGDIAHYKGGDIVPCMLEPKQSLENFKKKRITKTLKTLGAHSKIAEFFADVTSESNR